MEKASSDAMHVVISAWYMHAIALVELNISQAIPKSVLAHPLVSMVISVVSVLGCSSYETRGNGFLAQYCITSLIT